MGLAFTSAPLIISLIIGFIFFSFLFVIFYQTINRKKQDENFINNVREYSTIEFEETSYRKSFLDKVLDNIEVLGFNKNKEKILALGLTSIFLIFIVSTIIFEHWAFGLIFNLLIMFLLKNVIEIKKDNRRNLLNNQLNNFISMLQNGVQANMTPELALLSSIANTESPLYDELKVVENIAQTGSFRDALSVLRSKTNSQELKFLCSCIEISSTYGSSLQNQLVKIREVLEKKMELNRKLTRAANEQKPLIYIGIGISLGIFIFTRQTNEFAKQWWFSNLTSWIAFFGSWGLLAIGIFFMKRFIKKLDDLK